MLLGLAVIAVACAVGVGVASSNSLPVGVALLAAPALVVFGFLVVQGPKWCLAGSDRRRGLRLCPRLGHTWFDRPAGSRSVPRRARGLGRRAPSPRRATRLDPGPAPARAVASGAGVLALPAARARRRRHGRARRLASPRRHVRAGLARALRALPGARHRVRARRHRSRHHDRDLPGDRQCPRAGARRQRGSSARTIRTPRACSPRSWSCWRCTVPYRSDRHSGCSCSRSGSWAF